MLKAAYRENVILMQAIWNLAAPESAAPELVEIAAFGHEHIARTEFNSFRNGRWHFDSRYSSRSR